jgi:hypothetical protein
MPGIDLAVLPIHCHFCNNSQNVRRNRNYGIADNKNIKMTNTPSQ